MKNPGNKIKGYEVVVYSLVVVNCLMVSYLGAVSSVGEWNMLFGALAAVIPLLCNRFDAVGAPQGATYVELVNKEGVPITVPSDMSRDMDPEPRLSGFSGG